MAANTKKPNDQTFGGLSHEEVEQCAIASANNHGCSDNIWIEIDPDSCDRTEYPWEYMKRNEPKYKRFGDLVYIREIDKLVPWRKIDKKLKQEIEEYIRSSK